MFSMHTSDDGWLGLCAVRFLICALSAAALFAVATPASAASHKFTLHNFTGSDVTSLSVKDGKMTDFKRIPARASRTFNLEFPDGKCLASRVRIKFADGRSEDTPAYDVCSESGLTVVGP